MRLLQGITGLPAADQAIVDAAIANLAAAARQLADFAIAKAENLGGDTFKARKAMERGDRAVSAGNFQRAIRDYHNACAAALAVTPG